MKADKFWRSNEADTNTAVLLTNLVRDSEGDGSLAALTAVLSQKFMKRVGETNPCTCVSKGLLFVKRCLNRNY